MESKKGLEGGKKDKMITDGVTTSVLGETQTGLSFD